MGGLRNFAYVTTLFLKLSVEKVFPLHSCNTPYNNYNNNHRYVIYTLSKINKTQFCKKHRCTLSYYFFSNSGHLSIADNSDGPVGVRYSEISLYYFITSNDLFFFALYVQLTACHRNCTTSSATACA